MEERFLFDGIKLKAANISMGNKESTASIESNAADSIQAIENDASVSAGKATHASVFEPLIERAFTSVGFEDFLKTQRICFPNAERINSMPK